MGEITITFDVDDVDATKIDPHELADYLLDLASEDSRRNGPDERWGDLGMNHMSAKWGDNG